MSVPGQVFKTHLDSADDDPSQARAQLSAAIDAINQFRTHFLGSPLTSGSSVVSPSGGLAISGSDLLTSFGFAAKTADYTAVAADRGKVINFTTAGVTLNLTAAGTLGDGWWCIVVNSDTSNSLTIDPNSSETINGATTIVLGPGESAIIICNGTLFVAHVFRAAATQAQMEAATGTDKIVSPGRMQYHPGIAKAWVNFNGTGAVSVRRHYNVSSISDNGTGDYTVNFITPFADANYAFGGMARAGLSAGALLQGPLTSAPTTTAFRFGTATVGSSPTLVDAEYISLQFWGDQ